MDVADHHDLVAGGYNVMPTLTVGTLCDATLRIREIGKADVREIDVAELVADSTLLAEFVLIVIRDPEQEVSDGD